MGWKGRGKGGRIEPKEKWSKPQPSQWGCALIVMIPSYTPVSLSPWALEGCDPGKVASVAEADLEDLLFIPSSAGHSLKGGCGWCIFGSITIIITGSDFRKFCN